MIAALLLAAATAPQPGEIKSFGDWTAGCDNGRACRAVALLREDGAEGAMLTLTRGPGANAAPEMWVTLRVERARPPERLVIDGRSFPLAPDRETGTLRVPDALAAARLLGQATSIAAVGRAGGRPIPVSATGSAAALLYLDEQQRRPGTTGALVRRGAETRVPPPPALPLVLQPAPPRKRATGLSTARLRRLLGEEATRCEYPQELSVETARLDARNSLVLASHPCGNGAYNFISSALIVDEAGKARPAAFDYGWGRAQERPDHHLYGASWDADTRKLSTFFKGRGIGDCGNAETYVWDGTRFRLIHQSVMSECRGSTDYITTWRAEVR